MSNTELKYATACSEIDVFLFFDSFVFFRLFWGEGVAAGAIDLAKAPKKILLLAKKPPKKTPAAHEKGLVVG
jgi:hypothetical protein